VRKAHFPWILAGILLVGYAGWHLVGLIIAAVGLLIAYLLSLRVHPRMRHTGFRGCGGSGEHRGAIFTWTHRRCPGCQGGRIIRWGAGQFGAGHIQAEASRSKRAREAARDQNRWR
jgi:hypothetical protein